MFLWQHTRESPGPGLLWHSPPGCRGMSVSNWHTAAQHGEVGWRNGTKSPQPTHSGFAHSSLTCSAAESYLPCRIGPTHVLIWAQMRNWLWLNTFANHLGPLVNIHRRAATSKKCPASTCEVQRRLDILIVSRGSVTQCPAARCQEQSYIVVTFPPRPPPVHPLATLTLTPSVHTLITRGSCNKIPSLYPPILPYLTSFKNASILHAFSFPLKFQGIECQMWREKLQLKKIILRTIRIWNIFHCPGLRPSAEEYGTGFSDIGSWFPRHFGRQVTLTWSTSQSPSWPCSWSSSSSPSLDTE